MNNRTDIWYQIKKYLNGELDARAMYLFEKEAHNDPFLMDALEGYIVAGGGDDDSLDYLIDRLKSRITKPDSGSSPWKIISIIFIISLLISAAGWWIKDHQPETKKEKVIPAKTQVTEQTELSLKVNKQATADSTVIVFPLQSAKDEKINSFKKGQSIGNSRTFPVNPDIKNSKGKAAKQSISNNQESISLEEIIAINYVPSTRNGQDKKALNTTKVDSAMQGGSSGFLSRANGEKDSASIKETASSMVSGEIRDGEKPLLGAKVRIAGTDVSTVTGTNGKFTLPLPANISVLEIGMAGYANKQVKIDKPESLVIALDPDKNTSSKSVDNSKNLKRTPAEICHCWNEFEEYLKQNAISPDQKEGTVKLSFMVDKTGQLKDFKIIKGLSEQTNKAAIELVKAGPEWVGDKSGKPKKVVVKIKYTSKKSGERSDQ